MRRAALPALLLAACIQGDERPGVVVTGGDAERGRTALAVYGCGACHVIPGVEEARGTVGPPLTGWVERQYIAGSLRNQPPELVRFILDPQGVEPGTAMPAMGLSPQEAVDVAAYLYTLGDANPLGPPHLLPVDWLRGLGNWDKPGH